jgi:16S rRNA (guanine(966)-N(2))-methyltransferase RsmD
MRIRSDSFRITGGKFKSRYIKRVNKDTTREASDLVKLAFFNALGNRCDNNILDIFGGSGAYGIEAISRGGKVLYTNDIDYDACKTIETNLKSLGIFENSVVNRKDYLAFVESLDKSTLFSLIFVAPPYKLLTEIDLVGLFDILYLKLEKNGCICLESDFDFIFDYPKLSQKYEKLHGRKKLRIFQKI